MKTIPVPEYLLKAVLRHYGALAAGYKRDSNLKAVNAQRVAAKEIARVQALMDKESTHITNSK